LERLSYPAYLGLIKGEVPQLDRSLIDQL